MPRAHAEALLASNSSRGLRPISIPVAIGEAAAPARAWGVAQRTARGIKAYWTPIRLDPLALGTGPRFSRERPLWRIKKSKIENSEKSREDQFFIISAAKVGTERKAGIEQYSNATHTSGVKGCCPFLQWLLRSAAMPRSKPARCPRSDRTGVRCRSTAGSWSRERLFSGGCQPERRNVRKTGGLTAPSDSCGSYP
jgi:hypothetical protein